MGNYENILVKKFQEGYSINLLNYENKGLTKQEFIFYFPIRGKQSVLGFRITLEIQFLTINMYFGFIL